MKSEILGFNDDGTADVETQQIVGAMQDDLEASAAPARRFYGRRSDGL